MQILKVIAFYVLIQCLHVKVVLPYPVNWLMFSNFSITQG